MSLDENLLRAIKLQKKVMVRASLQFVNEIGMDSPNPDAFDGPTPYLVVATRLGNHEIVQLLLNARADTDIVTTDTGETALHVAISLGFQEIVEHLLDANANPDLATTNTGETALHVATKLGNHDIVQRLLVAGANTDLATTDTGETALHIAIKNGFAPIINLLKNNADLNIQTRDTGQSALDLALEYDLVDAAGALIDAGADVNLARPEGVAGAGATPTFIAAQKNYPKVLTWLHQAASTLYPNRCETKNGFTPLMIAAQQNHHEVVDLLVGFDNENINYQAYDDWGSALHVAVRALSIDAVRILISGGAKVTAVTSNNSFSPLYLACSAGSNMPDAQASNSVAVEIINLFFKLGMKVTALQQGGFPELLSAAAKTGCTEVVTCLLEAGANKKDIDKIGSDGFTALWHAVAGGYLNIVEILKDAGATLDQTQAKQHGKLTVLHAACQTGNLEIVRYLLESTTVNVNKKTSEKKTPLDLACEAEHLKVIQLLVQHGAKNSSKAPDYTSLKAQAAGAQQPGLAQASAQPQMLEPVQMSALSQSHSAINRILSRGRGRTQSDAAPRPASASIATAATTANGGTPRILEIKHDDEDKWEAAGRERRAAQLQERRERAASAPPASDDARQMRGGSL